VLSLPSRPGASVAGRPSRNGRAMALWPVVCVAPAVEPFRGFDARLYNIILCR
jgi:hypothetical protein